MSTRSKAAFALIAALLCSSDTVADGVWNPGVSGTVRGDGINNSAGMGSVTPPTPCAQTGLDFTQSCNAILYVTVL